MGTTEEKLSRARSEKRRENPEEKKSDRKNQGQTGKVKFRGDDKEEEVRSCNIREIAV